MPRTKKVAETVWSPSLSDQDIEFLSNCDNVVFKYLTLPSGIEAPPAPLGKRWRVHVDNKSIKVVAEDDKS